MDITTETYNNFAGEYARKFAGIGARVRDIERAFELSGKTNPRVLELGCGDGRDAVEINKLTDDYIGIDYSSEMITLAKKKVSEANFLVEDIKSYQFHKERDVIFAFASLLHLDVDEVKELLAKARNSLSEGGVFHISLKRGQYDGPQLIRDSYGERVFYFYQKEDILEIADGYEVLCTYDVTIGKTNWIDIVLRNK